MPNIIYHEYAWTPRCSAFYTHKRKIIVYTFRGLVQTRHHGQVLWLHLTFPLSAISWQSQTERSVFDTHMQLFEITKNDNAIFTCYILSGKLSCMDRVIGTLRLLGFLVGHCYLGGMGCVTSWIMLENHIIWAKIGWIQVLK